MEIKQYGSKLILHLHGGGAKSGTFSLVNGGGEAAGTFSQSLAGVAVTEMIVDQTAWNVDKLDGTSFSGITLDSTKGNVYQIRYQWLGFGEIEFFIEDSETGRFILVHRIKYANSATIPSIDNPTLPLFVSSKNISNTSDILLKVGSMGGFTEGKNILDGLPHSLSVEVSGIGDSETPVMSIHPHDIYQGTVNRVKIKMTIASISVEGTKPATIRLRKNAITTGPVSYSALDSNISTIHRDTTATGVSGGTIVYSQSIEKVGHATVNLEQLGITLSPSDFLTLSIEASSGFIDTVCTLNWQELFSHCTKTTTKTNRNPKGG